MSSSVRRLIRFVMLSAILIVIQIGSAFVAQAAPEDKDTPPQGKLPADVIPTSYALDLTVIPNRERFSGQVTIDVTLVATSSRIWLHGRDIAPRKVLVRDSSGAEVPARYDEIGDTGVARLVADRPVGPGKVKLIIEYDAPFNRSLEGLYRVDTSNASYAYTQFQPLSARRAFPGFDEPRFKTPFDITLTVESNHTAISNAPEQESVALDNGLKRIRFKTTKPLPTYLVAIAVGDFDVIEWDPIPVSKFRDRVIPLRGIAAKGKGNRFRYALEHTGAMIGILEAYFGIAYPYEKLDLIAAAEFRSGGMENVGAITYRESLVLFDKHPSIYQKRDYAYTHAHELAHQWFGNLVTPAWWDDLWLNEAFATWMSDRVVHAWRRREYDDRPMVRSARRAMRSDRLVSTRQIRQPILSNHDIANAFDRITYSKGGGVLAMFERFIGPIAFRSGVRRFLNRFAHGTATAEDFIHALAESTGDDRVITAFRSFLEQPGVPLLEIDWSCDTGDRIRIAIKQSRYLPLGSKGSRHRHWKIPVCLAYEEKDERKQRCILLTEVKQQEDFSSQQCPRWIMPNEAGAGYYNWFLKAKAWDPLYRDLNRLTERERLSLVGNLSATYEAGLVDVGTYLEVAAEAAQSESWDVAKSPMQILRNIKNFVLPKDLRPKAQEVYRQFYRPALARLGLLNESLPANEHSSNAALLRGEVVWFMALDANDPSLRKELSRLGQTYVGYGADGKLHPELLDPNLIRVSLIVAAQELRVPFFDALVTHLNQSKDAVFRNHVINTLAFQTKPELTAKVRALFMDDKLKKREASRLLYRHSYRVANREAIWDWATVRFDDILKRIPRSHQGSLPWLAGTFCSLKKRDHVQSFFKPRIASLEGGPRSLANVLENIEICAATVERHRADAVAYFRQN